MSETQNFNERESEKKRPVVSPEQFKVFSNVYRQLTRFASEHGKPHAAVEADNHEGVKELEDTVYELEKYFTMTNDTSFVEAAVGGEATVYSDEGIAKPGWIFVNNEKGVERSGYLATVGFQKSPQEWWHQDIYTFFADGNVKYVHWEDVGVNWEEEGVKDRHYLPTENATFKNWLNESEIGELGLLLESAKPGWLPEEK